MEEHDLLSFQLWPNAQLPNLVFRMDDSWRMAKSWSMPFVWKNDHLVLAETRTTGFHSNYEEVSFPKFFNNESIWVQSYRYFVM
jgi:hypothetical protein